MFIWDCSFIRTFLDKILEFLSEQFGSVIPVTPALVLLDQILATRVGMNAASIHILIH